MPYNVRIQVVGRCLYELLLKRSKRVKSKSASLGPLEKSRVSVNMFG